MKNIININFREETRVYLLLITLIISISPPLQAAPETGSANSAPTVNTGSQRQLPTNTGATKLVFNFQDADVEAVVKTVSRMTGRNFLLDPRVKGKITIISSTPVSKYAAYQIFLSALKAQGFTAVTGTGGIVKIIPVGEGKQNAAAPGRSTPSGGDRLVTHVVAIENGDAKEFIPLLRPLMAPTSQLSAYSPANSLIITDYAQNIRRLLGVIHQLDQPLNAEVTVIPLKYASAVDMADLISRTMYSGRRTASTQAVIVNHPGLAIVPDLRTNSLLVRSDNPGQLKQLKSLVSKLDVVPVKGGNTHVVYLRNADAEKLAKVLQGLLSANAATKAGKKSGTGLQKSLIQADTDTNSLIINSTDAVYNNMRAVIEKLDIRRAQVYVEALIAEVTSDKASELGFQWAAVGETGGNVIGATTNFTQAGSGSLGSVATNPASIANASGVSIAVLGPEVTIGTRTVRSIGGLARALEEVTSANILSTPNLLTLDNAEAEIIVGQNVPFVTGSYATTGSTTTVNPFQTVERKDVGLTLKIKPQISEGGLVKLDIFQEVSTVVPTTTSGAADIVTNKRSLQTTVSVDDGNTIVLGGLIEDKIQNITQKIRGLGSVPLLGALFRYKKKTKVKTNLMVFLKPTILYNASDAYTLTGDRYRYLMGRNKKADKERVETLQAFEPAKPKPPVKKENRQGAESGLLGPGNVEQEKSSD
jgi:general secretion pathway protein D